MKRGKNNKKKRMRFRFRWITPILALIINFIAWAKGVHILLILMGFCLAGGMIFENILEIRERRKEEGKSCLKKE